MPRPFARKTDFGIGGECHNFKSKVNDGSSCKSKSTHDAHLRVFSNITRDSVLKCIVGRESLVEGF